ncbi:uncharacterized protein BDR25DRAFT_339304 [Lindgomyces ingoldianus]|uniref:Uncharacterized protein n=1 Tax=Lindgomyces ingoldianus TaxID=673940 RepID=A0ACB6RA60_9PLEO|nr:uncharacterized protein BDR25DRAFT_339304 [Lindgomyces ingoldianus]KAF2476208.1 hypothetical protein BDR25DRAFT_339304 [Lindgomyces ingoldianus]
MAVRSKPLAAQQRLPMPSSEDRAHPRNRKRLLPLRTSRVEKTSAIGKESTVETDNKQQEASKTTTRKRPRTTEAKQTAELRRSKRSRKLAQQPLPLQQSEGRKRRLNISESGATGASHKRARHNPDKAAVDSSAEQEEADNVNS